MKLHCLWSGYNSVYRRSYVLAIGGSVFIEAGAVEIFAFSLENHHGVNSEKNWVYGLIITDVSFLTISCVKQLILVATRLEKHFLDASKHDISALLSTSSADVTTGTNCCFNILWWSIYLQNIIWIWKFDEKTIGIFGYIKKNC
ncbi:uncharacterized protein OCT59_000466 [Rhizophagus irregularis]|uniref:uncharacterized protein n=1 Tax=Rhizophagus irregularis TaxID=588596 RepID=UPI0033305CBE|nr:hypothetical protein OCT59_000466 [Rhizophagus irregularis]